MVRNKGFFLRFLPVVALSLLACQSEPAGPSEIPLVDRVVFLHSDTTGSPDLFYVSMKGGEPVRLTEGGIGDGCPSQSPDGNTIVFGSSSLKAIDANGSNLRDLAPALIKSEAYFRCASWSPDGTRLTVVRRIDRTKSSGTSDLFVINADGSGVKLIAAGDRFYQVKWAPSSDKIMFSSSSYTDGGPYDFAVNVINADGSGLQRIPQRWFGADWSPDESRVAFVCGAGLTNALCVSEPNGTAMATLTPSGMLVRDPAWSPVGNTIAFSCAAALCAVNADGTELRTLVPNGGGPVWSPDGTLIVYSCGTGALCAIKPDGSANRTLVDLPGNNIWPSFSQTP